MKNILNETNNETQLNKYRDIATRPISNLINTEQFNDYDLLKFDSEHLGRHIRGEISGSQFEGFDSVQELEQFILDNLPINGIEYKNYKFGKRTESVCELSIDCTMEIGTEMAMPTNKFNNYYPEINLSSIKLSKREDKDGITEELNGTKGTWYPKTNFKTGEIERDEEGNILEPRFAFEPDTKTVEVYQNNLPKTNTLTIIIKKIENRDTGDIEHIVVMASPGENLPMIPKEIPEYGIILNKDSIDSFNNNYVFIKNLGINPELVINETEETKRIEDEINKL